MDGRVARDLGRDELELRVREDEREHGGHIRRTDFNLSWSSSMVPGSGRHSTARARPKGRNSSTRLSGPDSL